MLKTCFIYGAGERCKKERIGFPNAGDVVIAADGGLGWLNELGILPDRIIGDFDSLGYVPSDENVELLPVEKDDTDTGIAVKRGLALGCKRFVIYGGTGGRADHTMANYQLLSHLSELGCHGFLVDDRMTALVMREEAVSVRGTEGGDLSVFSLSDDSCGVSISGAKYELTDGTLTNTFALGVSNSFTGRDAAIAVKKGTLLVMGAFLPENVRFD